MGDVGILKNSKQLMSAVAALPIPYLGEALAKAQPLLFSAIRNQIVCVDDLERRGSGLSVKDVFGLISYLREQRKCKIVVLPNQRQLERDKSSREAAAGRKSGAKATRKPRPGAPKSEV
jgi:hypothetical protein